MKNIRYLHELGYDLYTIPKLTIAEINWLIEAENVITKERQRKDKLSKKSKRGRI